MHRKFKQLIVSSVHPTMISLACLRFVSSSITLASSITGASSFTRAEGGDRSGKFGLAGLAHRSTVALVLR
jgi:hypothetical protein